VRQKPIKHRNFITELWNEGHSALYISGQVGVSVDKVEAYLKSAKAGYNTPGDMATAANAAAERKAARKVK
jgi:hypothetical protein